MNAGQEKFFQFIIGSVKEECREDAKALLAESFAKQEEGTFDKEYLAAFIPKMMGMVREDAAEQVKGIMMNFQSKF